MVFVPRPSRPTFTSGQVTEFFFRPCCDDYDEVILEYFRCRCGTVRKQTHRNGLTNLMQHVRHEHPNFETKMLEATMGETGSLLIYVRRTSQNLFGWLLWIVLNNLSLSFCENRTTRRLKTELRPIIRQDTRWASTFSMLQRYFRLLEHLKKEDDDIADMLPSRVCNRRLRSLLKELKDVESVSKTLQGTDADLLNAREWFDGLVAVKPQYAAYLGPRADIVHSPDFESGCVRVLRGNTSRLTTAEKIPLRPFAAGLDSDDDEEEGGSFVERLQKRRRLAEQEHQYALLRSITPTSNTVERFFSTARVTFGHERKSLHPITLEQIFPAPERELLGCTHRRQPPKLTNSKIQY